MPYTPDEWQDLPSLLTPIVSTRLRKLGAQYQTVIDDLAGPIGEQIVAGHLDSAGPAYDAVRTLVVEVINELTGGDPRSPIGFDPNTGNPVLLIERP